MKVALVHDYLKEYGGAERVLEALHEMFPEAPVYTAYYDSHGLRFHNEQIKHWDIKTSWMQKWSLGGRLISPLRVFAPATFENFDLTEYDLVISSSSTYFANSVITRPDALHINYIHTPPRYLYGYATSYNYKKHWWTRISGEIANHFLRLWDFEIAQRPEMLIANSENVAKRIKKFYRREAVVIYPPVNVEALSHQLASRRSGSSDIRQSESRKLKTDSYFLSVGRLVRGKGIDIIVKACSNLNLSLKVVGSGPLLNELKKIANKNVEFLGHIPDEKMAEIYTEAKATIVASEDEDFGIVPVESQSCGTPVLAFRGGGFLETVIPGKTGEFFPSTSSGQVQATISNLEEALKKFNPEKYDIKDCQKNTERFSKKRFKKEMMNLIEKNLKN